MKKDESRRIISYSTERKSILVNNSQAEKSGRKKKYQFYLILFPANTVLEGKRARAKRKLELKLRSTRLQKILLKSTQIEIARRPRKDS